LEGVQQVGEITNPVIELPNINKPIIERNDNNWVWLSMGFIKRKI